MNFTSLTVIYNFGQISCLLWLLKCIWQYQAKLFDKLFIASNKFPETAIKQW